MFDLILADLESITRGNSVGQLLLSTWVCPKARSKPSVTHTKDSFATFVQTLVAQLGEKILYFPKYKSLYLCVYLYFGDKFRPRSELNWTKLWGQPYL